MKRIAWLALFPAAAGAVDLGQVDTFSSTMLGWTGGASMALAPNGPGGPSDQHLTVSGFGGFGPGSVMAFHNSAQWAGNYLAEGVRVLEADAINRGATDVDLRVVLFGPLGGKWTSSTPVRLPAGGSWSHVRFSLDQADLTQVSGTESFAQTVAGASQLMIRHQTGAPSSGGTAAVCVLGIDNIRASARRQFQGTVVFRDFAGAMPTQATFQVRKTDLTPLYSKTVNLAANGSFSLDAPLGPGQYSVSLKIGTWLKKSVVGNTLPGNATGMQFDLVNGDIDSDDAVTVFDYALLSAAFDTSPGHPNWIPEADLDGDESVTVFDYAILSANFDLSGDA